MFSLANLKILRSSVMSFTLSLRAILKMMVVNQLFLPIPPTAASEGAGLINNQRSKDEEDCTL